MADDPKQVLFAPDGVHVLGGEHLDRVELRPGVMIWFQQFADVAAALHLGIHCSRCGKDVIGRNADSDKMFAVVCGCREFVSANRDWRPSAPVSLH